MQNPHYLLLSTNAVQFMSATSLHSTSSTLASSTSSGESSENSPTEGSVNRNRCPNWSDAETRFLLETWRDSFPISRRRNSGAWDTIAKKLNNILKEQKISSFRTGVQCKARIKYLQDEYKRVKDHNSRSRNDREPLNTSKKSTKFWAASQTLHQSAYLNVAWPPMIPALKRVTGKIHRTPVHQSTRVMRINWKWSSRRP